MTEIMETLASLSLLVFVIGSMASMGLSLRMNQILAPLKNLRLVILALVANFVLVPIVAYVITLMLPLDEPLEIGLILLATAAGAPFLPKLAEVAKGNIAFSVGLMVLLMIVTIIYLPIVLPLLLGGVEVSPWDIAQSLIVMMLVPLAIGLFINVVFTSLWPRSCCRMASLRQAPLGFARDRQDRHGLDPISCWGSAVPWADSSV